jgi:predicted RNase H-like nuclease (RuvC/YqgF family)
VIFLVADIAVKFALLCCCVIFITMVSLSVLFIPKLRLLFRYTEEELREMNEAQLQAVIRSYTKKFASSSDQKTSTNKGGSNNAPNSLKSKIGSSYEDEMANFANTVKSMSNQMDELKKEVKRLKETTPSEYRDLYEKYYHENMTLKNRIFELEGKLRAVNQMPKTINSSTSNPSMMED